MPNASRYSRRASAIDRPLAQVALADADLEVQVDVGARRVDALRRARLAREADDLPRRDRLPHLDAGRDRAQVDVAADDLVAVVDPDLPPAVAVEDLLALVAGRRGRVELGLRDLGVVPVGADHDALLGRQDRRRQGDRQLGRAAADGAAVEVDALVDAVAVGPRRARQQRLRGRDARARDGDLEAQQRRQGPGAGGASTLSASPSAAARAGAATSSGASVVVAPSGSSLPDPAAGVAATVGWGAALLGSFTASAAAGAATAACVAAGPSSLSRKARAIAATKTISATNIQISVAPGRGDSDCRRAASSAALGSATVSGREGRRAGAAARRGASAGRGGRSSGRRLGTTQGLRLRPAARGDGARGCHKSVAARPGSAHGVAPSDAGRRAGPRRGRGSRSGRRAGRAPPPHPGGPAPGR